MIGEKGLEMIDRRVHHNITLASHRLHRKYLSPTKHLIVEKHQSQARKQIRMKQQHYEWICHHISLLKSRKSAAFEIEDSDERLLDYCLYPYVVYGKYR